MKRTSIALSALLLFAAVASAGNVQCNASMVSGGFCPDTTHRLLYYPIPNTDPDGGGPLVSVASRLVDAIALAENYQETIGGQPNPETKVQFADRMIKERLRAYMQRALELAGETAKQQAIDADPVPVLP